MAGVDMVTAATLSFVDEAIGIARAARAIGVPIVISFTLNKNGLLETGESLREAVEKSRLMTQLIALLFTT